MNLTTPLLSGAVHATELPGASLIKTFAASSGFFTDDSADGGLGLLMSGLAGVAAALAVAIMLTVYFRSGYRSARDILRHSLAAVLVFGLLAFVVFDMRNAALAYLGINPSKPAAGLEIGLPQAKLAWLGMTDASRPRVL
jgi:hypothetical protein